MVVKTSEHAHTVLFTDSAQIPIQKETTTTYLLTELDQPIPDSIFTFVPPVDAKLIDQFPDLRNGKPSLAGQRIPDLNLKTSDGKIMSMTSLRGKPVLLDIWATWCAPCVKGLENLAALRQQTKDSDLVIISIDQDEDAKTATDMLAKKGYTWPNVHDDGGISKALENGAGVPRQILVNGEGKVIYDKMGGSDDEIRSAITSLGSQYASLAPKTQAPCGTQISSK